MSDSFDDGAPRAVSASAQERVLRIMVFNDLPVNGKQPDGNDAVPVVLVHRKGPPGMEVVNGSEVLTLIVSGEVSISSIITALQQLVVAVLEAPLDDGARAASQRKEPKLISAPIGNGPRKMGG